MIFWTLPSNEVEGGVSYTLQITSSCVTLQDNNVFSGIQTKQFQFTNLCPATEYTVSIRTTELDTNVTGVYGNTFQFKTLPGIPSEPRALRPVINMNDGTMEMTVVWGIPENPNGNLTQYEIRWSPSNTLCSNVGIEDQQFSDFVDGSLVTEYKTSNLSNLDLENRRALLVCVRAYIDTQEGEWARFFTDSGVSLGLTDANTATSTDVCTNLIVVAVIASLAVLSTIVLGLILVLVICYNGWTPLKDWKDKRDDVKVDDSAKTQKHQFKKQFSNLSTNSRTPLKNGSVSS